MFPFASHLNAAGWCHLGFFGILIPLLVVRSRKKLVGGKTLLPNRLRHFQSTAFGLILFAGLSLMVAKVQWIQLFPPSLPPVAAVLPGWPRTRRP